jgi:phosphoribosyl 1,2-cyclic phosphodiesterase
MDVVVLGSGSAGNSCLAVFRETCFLIDAGLSAKRLVERTAAAGIDPEAISAVFLTHEHHDHTAGLKALLKRRPLPVYCNPGTARALCETGAFSASSFRLFETGAMFRVGGVDVRSFSIPHDAADPVGLRFEGEGAAFGVLTDLGHATRLVVEALRGISGLLVETNYDEALLQMDTRRPWSVKQRIASRHGHLSNRDAAALLAKLDAPGLQTIVLAHLSRDCNTPGLALAAATAAMDGRTGRLEVHCACQEGSSTRLALT